MDESIGATLDHKVEVTSHYITRCTDANPKASISEKYTVILLFIRPILIYNTPVSGANEISFVVINHFLI